MFFRVLGIWNSEKVWSNLPCFTGDPEDHRGWNPYRSHTKPGQSCQWASLLPHSPVHSNGSFSWRRRGPQRLLVLDLLQPCASGTSWGGSRWLSGPWLLRPHTPGLHDSIGRDKFPCLILPFGVLWDSTGRHPTHTRIPSYFSIPKLFVCLFPMMKITTNS